MKDLRDLKDLTIPDVKPMSDPKPGGKSISDRMVGALSFVNIIWSARMCSGPETGSYLRLTDWCITQLKAEGPSRTCNESEEEEEGPPASLHPTFPFTFFFFFFFTTLKPRVE